MAELAQFPPSDVVNSAGLAAAVAAHAALTTPHSIPAQIATHEADTTNVHGIADTAEAIKRTDTTLAFFGNARVAQPAAYNQVSAALQRTVPTATAGNVSTTAATNVTPYGYGQAQANAIPTQINNGQADLLALKGVVNALIDDLQAYGLVV